MFFNFFKSIWNNYNAAEMQPIDEARIFVHNEYVRILEQTNSQMRSRITSLERQLAENQKPSLVSNDKEQRIITL